MSEDEHEPETAQEAFARMEGELALLRRAVERMAVERAELPEQPDYSETLAGMVQKIDATLQRADALVKAAKDGASPRHVVDRIVAAGGDARAEDRRTIATAAAELKDATRVLQGVTASARRGDEQNRWLMWTAIGGVVLGMVLWAVFAGVVARAVPASWQWPEKMAAQTLGGTKWEGARWLAAASYPDTWNAMVAGMIMGQVNQVALERCQKAANKAGEPVRCTVRIKPTAD
jgi:flagellar hook-basal body complex protein FliE